MNTNRDFSKVSACFPLTCVQLLFPLDSLELKLDEKGLN